MIILDGRCHTIFAIGTGISASSICSVQPENAILLISFCILGGLAPDLDSRSSTISRLTKPLSSPIYWFAELTGHKGWNHRWLLHDPVVAVLLALWLVPKFPFLFGFFLGMLSHQVLDSFTKLGIPIAFGILHLNVARIKSSQTKCCVFVTFVLTAGMLIASCCYQNRYPLSDIIPLYLF